MIYLLSSVLLFYISCPLSFHAWVEEITNMTDIVLLIGIFSSFLWLSTLTFDIWWSFRFAKVLFWILNLIYSLIFNRNFESPSEESSQLVKFYQRFALSFTVVLTFIVGFHSPLYSFKYHLWYYVFLSLFAIAAVEVVLIYLTNLKINEMSKNASFEGNIRFQTERERYENFLD